MFFTDSTGFFSLVFLLIQCVLAWIFGCFFTVLARGRAPWFLSLQVAFLGLGMGLTALSVRFLLAHHNIAGSRVLAEGDLAVRAMYGLYLAGKVMFVVGFAKCIAAWRRSAWSIPMPFWCTIVLVGFAVGFGLPTIEAVLLCQAPLVVAGCVAGVLMLRERLGEPRVAGQRIVRAMLFAMALAWVFYAVAACWGSVASSALWAPFAWLLRVNSLIDLALEVTLATGLIVAVMGETQRSIVSAHEERDRLRDQVAKDEKLRMMATLISGVAHEISNPLTAILGFAEDLEADHPAVRGRAAGIVREQAQRCQAIVQRISMLGRRPVIAAGAASDFDVQEVVQRVVRGLEPQLQSAQVEVDCQLEAGLQLHADPTGFEQVLTNLMTNAVHVTSSGGRIDVVVRSGGDGLQLSVRDRGPGVAAADRAHIFEPFWTTKRLGKGTGLGLAVADAIVRAHGGSIAVLDPPGGAGGAVFTVCWPLLAQIASDAARPPLPDLGRSETRVEVGSRLLVIDDESIVRATIRRQAEACGWTVIEVGSVERALQHMFDEGASFDAIVCDLRMPGLSGADFHDEVARRSPQLLLRTLFVTGDLASEDWAEFAARCRSDILTKPFVAADLLQRLGEFSRAG